MCEVIQYSIYDFELNELSKIKADVNGYIICEPDKSYVKRGDVVFLVQPSNEKSL